MPHSQVGGRVSKDLIIGAADNYGWDHVKTWATSIKKTGFSGDVVLIAYRVTDELVERCQSLGIYVIRVDHDDRGLSINHTLGNIETQAHKLRNFHIWQFLSDNEPYRTVAITDTRDIYFQTNPTVFFDAHQEYDIYFPSEAIRIRDEQWNLNMLSNLFGPFVTEQIQNNVVCNSGTIFGKVTAIKELMLNMYLIAKNFPATGADQPTMNVLNWLCGVKNSTVLNMDAGWACQCATTMEPTRRHLREDLLEPIPRIIQIDNKPCVVNSNNKPFVLVHQYDRVPELSHLTKDL